MVAFRRGDYATALGLYAQSLALFRELDGASMHRRVPPIRRWRTSRPIQPQRAARLLGAVEALLERIGARLDPD